MKSYIIKDVRLVDGSSTSLLIENGKIKEVNKNIDNLQIPVIIVDEDTYVSAGWIDMHVHCFKKFELYHDDCEVIGYQSGVTTVVDAGTAGADTIQEFYESIKNKKTNVFAFLNICKKGIFAQNELEELENLDVSLIKQTIEKYPDFIVGLKVRSSKSVVGSAKDTPLSIGINAAKEVELPVMVHIGTAPSTLETVVSSLRSKDIITHIYNPKENGIMDNKGKIKACVKEAIEKGIYLDIGHGTDSFSFAALDAANKEGIKVDSISTDIYSRNRVNGPVYDLGTTMNKFLNNGYTLEEVIDRVTKVPANILGLDHIGEIKEGKQADLTIFKIVKEEKELVDSAGIKKMVTEYVKPVAVIIKGEYLEIGE